MSGISDRVPSRSALTVHRCLNSGAGHDPAVALQHEPATIKPVLRTRRLGHRHQRIANPILAHRDRFARPVEPDSKPAGRPLDSEQSQRRPFASPVADRDARIERSRG